MKSIKTTPVQVPSPTPAHAPFGSEAAADDDLFDEDDSEASEVDIGQVMFRPDGYHWQSADGRREFGPFSSMEEAIADMELAANETVEPGESLQEAEDEIGISDWLDQETGEPAEGLSSPRLHDE